MAAAQFFFARAVLAGYTEAETAYQSALAARDADTSPGREATGQLLDAAAAEKASWQRELIRAQALAGV